MATEFCRAVQSVADDQRKRFLMTMVRCVHCDRELEATIALDFATWLPRWLLYLIGLWLEHHVLGVFVRCEDCKAKDDP